MATTAPAPAPENATTALYRAALGQGNTPRYLAVFAAFDERGMARAHWNTAAGLLSLFWLVYRGLWGRAVLFGAAVAALASLAWWMRPMWAAWPDGVAVGLLGLLVLLAVVVPGLGGDGWLHADVRARMTDAVRRARTVDEACQALARRRRVERWGLVALLLAGALALAVASWWSRSVVEAHPPAEPAPTEVAAVEAQPADTPKAAEPSPSAADTAPAASPAASEATDAPVASAEPVVVALPTVAEPVSAPAPAPAPAPPPAPTEAKPAVAASAPEAIRPRLKGPMVNVGLFADAANARRVQERLKAAKLPVVLDPVESSRGTLSRIRVGPFADKAQAEKAAAKVRALGLEAQVRTP
jgi:cell division septation protein DedD